MIKAAEEEEIQKEKNKKGRPYGGIGWIYDASLAEKAEIQHNSKRISTISIKGEKTRLTVIGVYLTSFI